MDNIKKIIICITLLGASGCSWFEATIPDQPHMALSEPFTSPEIIKAVPTPAPEQISAPPQPRETTQYIEVVWQIPADKVENYIIRYGTEKDRLSDEVRLNISEIQKVHHKSYGEVYRYLLQNTPRDKTVYVSVAAASTHGESAPSQVFEVAPEISNQK